METKFKVGDVVVLKSGGPKMVVTECFNDTATVEWFNEKDGSISRTKFIPEVLEQIVDFPHYNCRCHMIFNALRDGDDTENNKPSPNIYSFEDLKCFTKYVIDNRREMFVEGSTIEDMLKIWSEERFI